MNVGFHMRRPGRSTCVRATLAFYKVYTIRVWRTKETCPIWTYTDIDILNID
jgi:hypothetical protein